MRINETNRFKTIELEMNEQNRLHDEIKLLTDQWYTEVQNSNGWDDDYIFVDKEEKTFILCEYGEWPFYFEWNFYIKVKNLTDI